MNGQMYESEYEEAVVSKLRSVGWEYAFGGALHRLLTDPLYEKDLRGYVARRYAAQSLSSAEVDAVAAKLRNCGGSSFFDRLRSAVSLVRDGYDHPATAAGGPAFHLDFIDFDHPENNTFRAVNQFEMQEGGQTRIPDVLLLVNGIPVCIVELKNPTDANATIRAAHTQICTRYVRDIPSLLRFCALAVTSDGPNTRLGMPTAPYECFYAWKKVENEDAAAAGLDQLDTLVRGALAPARLLEILRDFVYFSDPSDDRGRDSAVVCRYPQFFAARKLRDSILAHMRTAAAGDGKGGVYFGATGCGKTYTMLFLARLLSQRSGARLPNPTVLLLVDREDLENQAGKLFARSKRFLCDDSVRVFESREDLRKEMSARKGGGVYVTTIQKFSEGTGLLTDRTNVVCMSDEAHRTQNNVGSELQINVAPSQYRKDVPAEADGRGPGGKKMKSEGKAGAFVSYGFAHYLRAALPNATYVGFTGTPIDETIYVFGEIVDSYTMAQAQADGITVPIKYDPRLARVTMDEEMAKKIEEYYGKCAEEGATEEDVAQSKKAMSALRVILADPARLERVAKDIVADYETRCADNPGLLQKAMVACADRPLAYAMWRKICEIRPEWAKPRKAPDESALSAEELARLPAVPFVNLVGTQGKDDEREMFEAFGDSEHRAFLDAEFKNEASNFRIAVVVDMWITGFDVPPLTVLYNDKPLQKHTLIQTISRVNRRYREKEYGYVVDYIGIRENMKEALKKYGGDPSPKEDVDAAHEVLQNELDVLKGLCAALDFRPFFGTDPLVRLRFLQDAAEHILATGAEREGGGAKGAPSLKTSFSGHVKRMKAAYDICHPAGVLTDEETAWAQCFMGIRSFLRKISDTPHDVQGMNEAVERMVRAALDCTGMENVLDSKGEEAIFGPEFLAELENVKAPFTKFEMLVKLLKKAIREYERTNKVKAEEFQAMLAKIVDEYNQRDNLTFANAVATEAVDRIRESVESVVTPLTEKLLAIFANLKKDREEFRKLGITFEEKAFFDILVSIRDQQKFEYGEEKCKELAKEIKNLVDQTSVYADFLNNDNLKYGLSANLLKLLYKRGYPPQFSEEVFEKVLAQVENFRDHAKPEHLFRPREGGERKEPTYNDLYATDLDHREAAEPTSSSIHTGGTFAP